VPGIIPRIDSTRRKFGNGLCNGCNGWKEEGRRKKEEGKLSTLPTLNSKFKIKT
jgi:hypothetical protein